MSGNGPQKYGIFGHPVAHSFSPPMQEAAFKHHHINAVYLRFDVAPEALKERLFALPEEGICGINITVPHKSGVYRYLKEARAVEAEAEKFAAVNTVTVHDGKISGTNTDGIGFLRALKEDLGFDPTDKKIFIIGAGGTARTLAVTLKAYASHIHVNATKEKSVEYLIEKFTAQSGPATIDGHASSDISVRMQKMKGFDLLINATPVGMKENDPELIDPDQLEGNIALYDVIYNPPETQFVHAAKDKRLKYACGLGMLLYQGAESFRIWTGKEAPIDPMRKALEACLNNKTH